MVEPHQRIRVWDLFVRIFHWSLVVIFFANFALNEEGDDWHQWLGYAAVVLLSGRLVWGFIGPLPARWSSFWPSPGRLISYWKGTYTPSIITHNPVGAVMMIILMLLILGLGITGYMMEEIDYFWGEGWLEEVHEIMANMILILVPLHILGAVKDSILKKDNLIAAMFHGYRKKD
ncbi:cytochrome b/b6 domain-containing protein [Oceanospirillum beijerinckii]|uniref:cytochrome b/b6 domain-containing protein n=1 Tax=Oceanospirillum beijerinckii TaxID=64976 RepID=UPI0004067F37|nr:cytochrome b/b6 domain-containing protein [Oceanospirillum beijerinckii]